MTNTRTLLLVCVAVLGALGAAGALQKEYKSGIVWPEPVLVTPGKAYGDPPSDATVLFDGKDLSKWNNGDKWEIKDGYAVVKGSDILTKDSFGDYQLHVEFATPEEVKGNGQGRGNSGVFLANRYEVQVLDSHDNKTYFDGRMALPRCFSPAARAACPGTPVGIWKNWSVAVLLPWSSSLPRLT